MNPSKSVPFIVLGLLSISNPAFGFQVTITPPPSLSLDNQQIKTGTFNVESATGFRINDEYTEIISTDLLTDGPVSVDVKIGSGQAKNLFEADNNIQAVQYSGFFDASNSGVSNRPYNLTVGAFNGNNNPEWTVFLPVNPGQSAFQITNLGSPTSDPNLETFSQDEPMLFVSQEAAEAEKTFVEKLINQNNPDVKPIWVGYNEKSNVIFKEHGTGVAIVPEPLTILGSVTAIALGLATKREYSKKLKKLNQESDSLL